MSPQNRNHLVEWLQIGANIGSLIVAVVALTITFNTENRSAERFREQLAQSNEIAKANIRPLLDLGSSGFIGVKLISLQNDGLGTAVVKKINFTKNEKSVLNLAELFEFKKKVVWDNFYVFTNSNYFLRAGESVPLLNLTAEGLRRQGYNESKITQILKEFDTQLKGIEIQIKYDDLQPMGSDSINQWGQTRLNIIFFAFNLKLA